MADHNDQLRPARGILSALALVAPFWGTLLVARFSLDATWPVAVGAAIAIFVATVALAVAWLGGER